MPLPDVVIFDLDGVLISSERIKARAHQETIAEYSGKASEGVYRDNLGRSHRQVADAFQDAAGIDIPYRRYRDTYDDRYRELMDSQLTPVPGAVDLVRCLATAGCTLGLVTSSRRWMAAKALGLLGVKNVFSCVVSSDDVDAEKPDPAPYLEALRRLDVDPRNAVVIEDTDAGVMAASRAGLQVMAVRHGENEDQTFSEATAVVEDLKTIDELLDHLRLGGGG